MSPEVYAGLARSSSPVHWVFKSFLTVDSPSWDLPDFLTIRTCLYPGTSTIGTVRPQSRWIFCYFLRPAPKVQNCLITTCASPVFPYDQVTPKIDVWALGVLLFQIVFKGALPFAEVRPHGSLTHLLFFNNIVVEIKWCPGCCIHTSPQGAWRPAWQDLCLREPQPSCTTPQHGGLGSNITWHDQVLNTDGRFNLQHLTCFGLYSEQSSPSDELKAMSWERPTKASKCWTAPSASLPQASHCQQNHILDASCIV